MTDPVADALSVRLQDRGVSDVAPLAGGASSLTYRAVQAGRPIVVKMAPPGHAPVGHRDVLRQGRMIAALSKTDVPVPELLWFDEGDPPEVSPLFAMSMIDGESFEPLFDVQNSADPVVPRRYSSAARAMAQLHRLAPASLDCADEPAGDASSEIDRWTATLNTVDPQLAPGWTDLRDALRANLPDPVSPSVVHGDFRLGNLLAMGDEITAVIDWEIWSIGDPRIDAGWFLINSDPATYRRTTPYDDLVPGVEALSAAYTQARGVPVDDLDYFRALACFKSTATWSLIIKHNRRRTAPDAALEQMAGVLPSLLGQARALLG